MAEYIDLNNTEVLTEAGENAKLVVEEDGELKRIPASAVGQVKTVNGVEPDEAGNVDVSAGGGAMIVRFTAESDSTVVSDTDIATVCEAMEAGRAVMGYLSPGGATFLVSNPVEYIAPRLGTAGMIKFRFAIMDTATSMQVIDLKITDRGVEMQQYAIGSTT